jgi:hypothetical protein
MKSNPPVHLTPWLRLACTLVTLVPALAFGQPVPDPPVDFDLEMRGVPWEGLDGSPETDGTQHNEQDGDYQYDASDPVDATAEGGMPSDDDPFASPTTKPGVRGDEISGVKPTAVRHGARRKSPKWPLPWRGSKPPRYSRRPLTAPGGHGQASAGLGFAWAEADDDLVALNVSAGVRYAVDSKLELGFAQISDPFADFGGPEAVQCGQGECYHMPTIWGAPEANVILATVGGPSALTVWDSEDDVDFMYWLGPFSVRYKLSDRVVFTGEALIPVNEFSLRFVSLRAGVEFKNPLTEKTALVGHALGGTTFDLSYLSMPLRVGLQHDFTDQFFGQMDLGFNMRFFRFTGLFAEDEANLFGGSFWGEEEDDDFDFDIEMVTVPVRFILGFTVNRKSDIVLAITLPSLKDDEFERLVLQLTGVFHF